MRVASFVCAWGPLFCLPGLWPVLWGSPPPPFCCGAPHRASVRSADSRMKCRCVLPSPQSAARARAPRIRPCVGPRLRMRSTATRRRRRAKRRRGGGSTGGRWRLRQWRPVCQWSGSAPGVMGGGSQGKGCRGPVSVGVVMGWRGPGGWGGLNMWYLCTLNIPCLVPHAWAGKTVQQFASIPP